MKKFFDKKLEQGKGVLKALKNELNEKPEIYQEVDALITQINILLKDKSLGQSNKEKDALTELKELKEDLKTAKTQFDKDTVNFNNGTGMSLPDYKKALADFAKTCNDSIHDHQTKIMAAPGVWNKLKAYVKNFMEKYLDVKDFCEIKETAVSQNKNFKEKFDQVKEMSRDNADDESRPKM